MAQVSLIALHATPPIPASAAFQAKSMREQIEARHSASPLRYGKFAVETQNEDHVTAARAQLGII